MLIDIHNHVMPDRGARPAARRSRLRGHDRGRPVDRRATTCRSRSRRRSTTRRPRSPRWTRNGIGSAVVSSPPPLLRYDVSSDRGAQLLRGGQRRDGQAVRRLPGPAALAGQPARCRIRRGRCRRTGPRSRQGCVGAAIGTSIAGRRLDEPMFEEFWAAAARSRPAGAGAPGVQPAASRARPLLPAERHRQPAGDHRHGGADDLRRGVRAGTRRCGWCCCMAAASCRTRRAGWPTPAGYGPRSR